MGLYEECRDAFVDADLKMQLLTESQMDDLEDDVNDLLLTRGEVERVGDGWGTNGFMRVKGKDQMS